MSSKVIVKKVYHLFVRGFIYLYVAASVSVITCCCRGCCSGDALMCNGRAGECFLPKLPATLSHFSAFLMSKTPALVARRVLTQCITNPKRFASKLELYNSPNSASLVFMSRVVSGSKCTIVPRGMMLTYVDKFSR